MTSIVDLHPNFDERYQDHEFFRHVNEAVALQPNALYQIGHSNNVHALEHGHFPFFPIHQNYRWNYFWKFGSFYLASSF
jgi:hypothetical protein